MFGILQEPVPATSLLRTYREGPDPEAWEHFNDCFSVTVDRPVTLAEFVYVFYTSPVFRIERLVLRLARLPSTDAEARQLADGKREVFAAWRVAQRTGTQLLMCDVLGRTRSWFCITLLPDGRTSRTLLQFGSGIAAGIEPRTGQRRRSIGFRLLGGIHTLYSQVLLHAACDRLAAAVTGQGGRQ